LTRSSPTNIAAPVVLGQAARYALAAAILFLFARGRLPPLSRRDAAIVGLLALTGLAGFNVLTPERLLGVLLVGAGTRPASGLVRPSRTTDRPPGKRLSLSRLGGASGPA